MLNIAIYVATVTGNAELVAEDVVDGLSTTDDDSGQVIALETDILMMENVTVDDICACELAVFVSSTYGVGDVPDNSVNLYTELGRTKPDLSQLRYGAVSLGDSTYDETFAFGGRKWDELLTECGAQRVGELLVLDASSNEDPQDLSIDWAKDWRLLLGSLA